MSISHKQVIKRGAKVRYKGVDAIVYQVNRPIGFSVKEPIYCLEIQNVKHSELESFLGYGESD